VAATPLFREFFFFFIREQDVIFLVISRRPSFFRHEPVLPHPRGPATGLLKVRPPQDSPGTRVVFLLLLSSRTRRSFLGLVACQSYKLIFCVRKAFLSAIDCFPKFFFSSSLFPGRRPPSAQDFLFSAFEPVRDSQ